MSEQNSNQISTGRFLCPSCLILDVHDIVKHMDTRRHEVRFTRCRHCGKEIKKPLIAMEAKRRASGIQVTCPRCGELGHPWDWHGQAAARIRHPNGVVHYVAVSVRWMVLQQLRERELEATVKLT